MQFTRDMMEAMSASSAVKELIRDSPVRFSINRPYTYENILFPEGYTKPSKEAYDEAFPRHLKIELFKELRQERNRRLAEVEWVFSTDYQMEDGERSVWVTYRQALRDLPSVTEDPTNPLWPTKPSTPMGTTTSVNIQQIATENASLRTKVTNLERKAASQELLLIELRKRVEKLGG